MTDFLSRLAERSAGRAAVAHPVVPPLFAAGPSLAGEPADGGAVAPDEPVRDTAQKPGEPPRARGSEEDALPAREVPAPTAGAPERSPRAPILAPPLSRRRARANLEERRLRPPLPRDAALPTESGRPSDAAEPLRAPAPVPGAEPTVPLRPREAVSFARAASAESAAAPPAPIVRISIGRIDVRAVPPRPAAPVAAPVRKDDRLSLEEYLRPRDGRR